MGCISHNESGKNIQLCTSFTPNDYSVSKLLHPPPSAPTSQLIILTVVY